MQLFFKENILYKKDPKGGGVLFSLGNDSDEMLKLDGLVDFIVSSIYTGDTLPEVRAKILEEYDVEAASLDEDLTKLIDQLRKLDFIKNE